jgi:hypothetical protein
MSQLLEKFQTTCQKTYLVKHVTIENDQKIFHKKCCNQLVFFLLKMK